MGGVPGSPVGRTPSFHCKIRPLWGTKILHASQCSKKKKEFQTKLNVTLCGIYQGFSPSYFQFSLQKYDRISFPYPLEVRCYRMTFWSNTCPFWRVSGRQHTLPRSSPVLAITKGRDAVCPHLAGDAVEESAQASPRSTCGLGKK